jgi:hypothetical protein
VSSTSLSNPFNDDRLTAAELFNPNLDVPSLHEHASIMIEQAVAGVSRIKQPDGTGKVIALRSVPGVGKTHVAGRVGHRLGEKALFVFVPQLDRSRVRTLPCPCDGHSRAYCESLR